MPSPVITIRSSFGCLHYELQRLNRRWRSDAPLGTVAAIVRATEATVARLIDRVALAPFAQLDEDGRNHAQRAFMHALVLASFLDEARDAGWAARDDLDCAYDAAIDLVDALSPCVSVAACALRRLTLHGEELERTPAWTSESSQPAPASAA